MSDLTKLDPWLTQRGPAALCIREYFMPVEGHDGVLFPATFAAGDDFKGGYNVDVFPDGTNVCLVDSVGSQANRIEPLFMGSPLAALVPQIVVTAGTRRVNLLEAGHRAGDAIVRCTALQRELQSAFKSVQKGDAEPLARIAPTSLVFGAWDSRDTQAKVPRLVASTVRAFDVRRLTRSAQYVPAMEYVKDGLLEEPADRRTSGAYAERGFVHVPASGTHGGVIATSGVRRDATLHLGALRLLRAGADEKKALNLQRYVLGLSLTALTQPSAGYLRQGCNLVADPDRPREFKTVFADGRREDTSIEPEEALEYARAAAKAFGLDLGRPIDYAQPPDRLVAFEVELAKRDVLGEGDSAEGKARKSKKSK